MDKTGIRERRDTPKLSVVVGSHNARDSVNECLGALRKQGLQHGVEVIVIDNSTDGTTEILRRDFPDVELVEDSASSFIPQLWETGIRRATGDIVALTTAHCVPGEGWVEEILKAHGADHPAIGGAIENEESAGLVEWAIYFCRYSPYMLPFRETVVKEIPGDNASYQRWALDKCQDVRRNGFWEPLVHAKLREEGYQLLMSPSIVVRHKRSFGLLGFIEQRFHHGRRFGSDRAERCGMVQRLVYIVMSPGIPLVYLWRIGKQVAKKRRHVAKLVLSLPVLSLFLLSWSAGELLGYLKPVKRHW
jgi:glycosyltransferase involved in cell wall biosynthesis